MNAPTTNPPVAVGGFTEAVFEAFLKSRDEPAWLRQQRRDAFACFQALPMPTARDEEWRRTDIRAFKLDTFGPPSSASGPEDSTALASLWQGLSEHYATGIEQVNGVTTRTADPSKLGGAIFVDLAAAARDYPAILEKYLLTTAVDPHTDAFSALHAAFWTGGTLLYVPKGVKVEAPLFSLVGLANQGKVDMDHTLVVLEEGAEATLVRETAGRNRADAPALHCRRRRALRRQRGEAPVREHPELGRRHLALQPRTCPGRSRRRVPMDSRRPGFAAREGQSGSCPHG